MESSSTLEALYLVLTPQKTPNIYTRPATQFHCYTHLVYETVGECEALFLPMNVKCWVV